MRSLVILSAALLISGCGHPDNGRCLPVVRDTGAIKMVDSRDHAPA